jgi:UDP-GlcNAc:undecaprenyl-phosphate GlcNAc-1-phosphate transferase
MNELSLLGPMAAVLTGYLIHRCRQPAEQLGLVDIPGGRKHHDGHTPLVGGVAMFVAFALCALLLSTPLGPYRALFAGMGLLLITGVLDDLQDLGAAEKFGLQLLAGTVLVYWGGLRIESLGVLPLVGRVDLGGMAIPFTLLCVVGLVNAINMKDGADGLAGSVTLSILIWLTLVGAGAGATAFALPLLLACSVIGFLAFNFPHRWRARASAFMGDSGSTMLGFAVAWFAIELAFRHDTGVPPVAIAWVLALPVFDTVSLILRRMAKGRSPMACDREHLHHVFQRAGFSIQTTVYLLAGAAFLMGAIGVGGWWLGAAEWALWGALIAAFAAYVFLIQHAWRVMRVLRRLRSAVDDQTAGSAASE